MDDVLVAYLWCTAAVLYYDERRFCGSGERNTNYRRQLIAVIGKRGITQLTRIRVTEDMTIDEAAHG